MLTSSVTHKYLAAVYLFLSIFFLTLMTGFFGVNSCATDSQSFRDEYSFLRCKSNCTLGNDDHLIIDNYLKQESIYIKNYHLFYFFFSWATLYGIIGFSFARVQPHIRRIIVRFVERIYNENLLKMEFSIQHLNYFTKQLDVAFKVLKIYLAVSVLLFIIQVTTVGLIAIYDANNLAKVSKLNLDNNLINFRCNQVNSTAFNSTMFIIQRIKMDIQCSKAQYDLNSVFLDLFWFISLIVFLLLLFNAIECVLVRFRRTRNKLILNLMPIDKSIVDNFKDDPNVYFSFVILLEYVGPKYFTTFRHSLEEHHDLVVEEIDEVVVESSDQDMLIVD